MIEFPDGARLELLDACHDADSLIDEVTVMDISAAILKLGQAELPALMERVKTVAQELRSALSLLNENLMNEELGLTEALGLGKAGAQSVEQTKNDLCNSLERPLSPIEESTFTYYSAVTTLVVHARSLLGAKSPLFPLHHHNNS